jgi:type IV fimbrial biogenesis protein FimT
MRHLNPHPHPQSALRHRGLTLVELMVAITIASFLVVAGAPYYADYTNNSRLREGGVSLQTEALFAQSEAIKRNRVVRLTTSGSTLQVLEANDPTAMTLLRQRTLAGGVTAATATVDFTPRGYPVNRAVSPSVDFVAASIDLSLAGVTCSSTQRCPGLRVDAGGGIRLCPDTTTTCP